MSNVTIEAVQILTTKGGKRYERHHLANVIKQVNGHNVALRFYANIYESGVLILAEHVFPGKNETYTFKCDVLFTRESWETNPVQCKKDAWEAIKAKLERSYRPADVVKKDEKGYEYEGIEIAEFLVNDAARIGQICRIDIDLRVYRKNASCVVRYYKNAGGSEGVPQSYRVAELDAVSYKRNPEQFMADLRQLLASKHGISLA